MIPEKFLRMFNGYMKGWKTVFDLKITDVTLYATYSDGHQEKFSYPIRANENDIIHVTHNVPGEPLKVVRQINVNEGCDEWFSCKEGYGVDTYPDLQQKIRNLYVDVLSKDYNADVFFTFEPSIKIDPIETPDDLLPNFPLGGWF